MPFLSRFLGRPMRVRGHSMMPLLRPGDLVWVRGVSARRGLQDGDVVVARPRMLGGKACVKRLYFSAGDAVLLGERRYDSLDSRHFGPVSKDDVVGRVWLRLWPPRILP